MSEAPSMPLFCDAYLADTMSLTLEEHGAYLKLLMITWRNNGQALPDDDNRLARMLGVTVGKWRTKLRPVLVQFFDLSEGTWKQKRLEKEWKIQQKISQKQRENAQARWKKENINSLRNNETGDATAYAKRMPPDPDPVREEDEGGDARARDLPSEPEKPTGTAPDPAAPGTDPTSEGARTVAAHFHKLREEAWPAEVNFPAPMLTLQSQAATVLACLPLATVLEVMTAESHRAKAIGMKAPQSLKAFVHAFDRAIRAQGGTHDFAASTPAAGQRPSRGDGAARGGRQAGSIVAATRDLLASAEVRRGG